MTKALCSACLLIALTVAATPSGASGQSISGKWEASHFLNRIIVDVVQEGNSLQGVLYLYPFGGEMSTYHFRGTMAHGRVEARHRSGHAFRGTVRGNRVKGTLTTKTGMRVPLHLDDLRRIP